MKYSKSSNPNNIKEISKIKNMIIVIGFFIFIGLLIEAIKTKNSNRKQNLDSSKSICLGNQSCIHNIRENFNNTGKTILGEEYFENGKFGISFVDQQYRVGSYNATVTTDCSCNIVDVKITRIR